MRTHCVYNNITHCKYKYFYLKFKKDFYFTKFHWNRTVLKQLNACSVNNTNKHTLYLHNIEETIN